MCCRHLGDSLVVLRHFHDAAIAFDLAQVHLGSLLSQVPGPLTVLPLLWRRLEVL
jgi:hypothetical protein